MVGKQPLMPLRKGHLALLVAGGLNDTVIEVEGRRLLLRGQVAKRTATVEANRNSNTTVEREYLSLEVMALDLDTAELIRVG